MTTPLTREVVYGWLTHDRNRDVHINAGVLSALAAALLAAWEERDALQRHLNSAEKTRETYHTACNNNLRIQRETTVRAEAAEADITTYQEIVSTMTQEAESADAKLAERDAANARLREALRSLEKTATETIRLGAVTGGHWSRITVANLKARSLLAELGDKP